MARMVRLPDVVDCTTAIVVVHPSGTALVGYAGGSECVPWRGGVPRDGHMVRNALVLRHDGFPVAASDRPGPLGLLTDW